MNFSSSCPVNFPPSPIPQTTYYFMLSFHFFTLVCLSPPNILCFSLRYRGFISLFRDGETILHARLELKQLSRFQTNMVAEVCLGADVCVFQHEILRGHFGENKTFTTHTHTESPAMTPILCPLDVWLLCE